MMKYRIRILMHSGTTQYFHEMILENVSYFSYGRSNYEFVSNDKRKYFPINNTIVEEL